MHSAGIPDPAAGPLWAWLEQALTIRGLTRWTLARRLAARCGYSPASIWRQLDAYRRGRIPRPGGWCDHIPAIVAAARHPDDPAARQRLQAALAEELERARRRALAARPKGARPSTGPVTKKRT
jgi:hypothetical protein